MATSQNGWPVLDSSTTGPHPRLRHWILPDIDRKLPLRDGSAGFLLSHIAMWFDKWIESVDTGIYDDWGWASRPIRGSTTISNHASGTAVDLNATKHPLGVATSRTYSSLEIQRIAKRLKFYRGCIRWGGFYSGRPDAMHWEINQGLRLVEKRARELCDSKRGKALLAANPGARAVIYS